MKRLIVLLCLSLLGCDKTATLNIGECVFDRIQAKQFRVTKKLSEAIYIVESVEGQQYILRTDEGMISSYIISCENFDELHRQYLNNEYPRH